jgi:hypothetical protein
MESVFKCSIEKNMFEYSIEKNMFECSIEKNTFEYSIEKNMYEWPIEKYVELQRKIIQREKELLKLKQDYNAEIYARYEKKDSKTEADNSRIEELFEEEDRINDEIVELNNLAKDVTVALNKVSGLVEREVTSYCRISIFE